MIAARMSRFLSVWTLFTVLSATLHAEVRLHALFSNGAVLQAGVPVPVWGTGRDGEKVTVQIQDQTVSAEVKAGQWKAELKPLKPGGPFLLRVQGDNVIEVADVLVGEVWLCSGQSNMAFQLNRADGAAAAISKASDPQLRFFFVPHEASDTPRSTVAGKWVESTPITASNFSAVAYFFGRELRRSRSVPVGLIESSVGGTPAEAWTSRETLEADPELKQILERYAESVKTYDPAKAKASYQKAKSKQAAAVAKARTEGKAPPVTPRAPADPARSSKRPSGLYNAMIAPLQPYAIAGVIWYQGEGNANRAAEYQKLFPAMIQNWRTTWERKDLPFFFVQIAPHERMLPEIREAQLLTAQRVPRTAMVVTTDIGDAQDIHPKKKQPVGERLALCARAIAYGEKIEYSGPLFQDCKIDGANVILSFSHATGGLAPEGTELKGFEIAGADGVFEPATAKVKGNQVFASSPKVPRPTQARYGWAKVPDVDLVNGAGLPASPFRTVKTPP